MGLATAPLIRRGDHACCVYGSDAAQVEFVARFARDAFARGDRLFYLADRSDESDVLEMLDAAGVDGRARLDSGALVVMHSSQMGHEGGFDPERQVQVWNAVANQAVSDGYGGLAAAAEMTWALSWQVDPHLLVEFESMRVPAFRTGHLAALCQYDSRHFDGGVLPRVTHAHSCAIEAHDAGWSADWSRLHLERAGSTQVLNVAGDIDLANIEFFEDQLRALLDDGDAVVDCAGIEFADVAGCRLLLKANAGELGRGRVELRNPPELLRRVMTLINWVEG